MLEAQQLEVPASRRGSDASVDSLVVEPSVGGSPVFPAPGLSYESWADSVRLARRRGDWSSPSDGMSAHFYDEPLTARCSDGGGPPSRARSRAGSGASLQFCMDTP